MERKYLNDYDAYEEGKTAADLVKDILADPELAKIDELIIGDWGGAYEDDCQPIIDGIVENADKFSHITKLFIGDMDFEECEVSWIMQGNYSELWKAMPQLKELTIKGSTELTLGTVDHENLESLTIICGGLGADVFKAIETAKLPELKKLLLYVGVDDYGFDGDLDTIKDLLANCDFPKLKYLGITDSDMQDDITELVLGCKYVGQLETIDLSCGTITDKGGELLLQKVPELSQLKKLDLSYNYFSDEMIEKLEALSGIEVDCSDQEEADDWNGELWYNPMLTE